LECASIVDFICVNLIFMYFFEVFVELKCGSSKIIFRQT
jgi:hypothetical protein